MWLLEKEVFSSLKLGYGLQGHMDLSSYDKFMAGELDYKAATSEGKSGEKVGVVPVRGVLTREPSFMAFFFGGGNTTYADIISNIAAFNADSSIDKIVLDVDSPGGEVSGLFKVFEALQNSAKPIEARVDGMACSAAYGIVTQASTITASNVASMVGSVGVVQSFSIDSDTIDITSREAPDKREDATTEAGVEKIKDRLDNIHELFAGAIAKGRGVSVDTVNKTYGRGGIVLANEAVSLGMVDCIADGAFNIKPTKNESATAGDSQSGPILEKKMDKQELEAKHPALYAEVLKLGADQGMAKVTDRVNAHLTLGEKCNAMDIALKAIKDGSDMNATLTAEYVAAGINGSAHQQRVNEDQQAGDAVDKAGAPAKPEASADKKFEEEFMAAFSGASADLGDFK